MPLPTPAAEPVQITVVDSGACHFCAVSATEELLELASRKASAAETRLS